MSNSSTRLVYAFPAVLLMAVLVYYLYGALDRAFLETSETGTRVTGKQVARGSTTYDTRIAGGRAWTQATDNAETYILTFVIHGQPSGGSVGADTYESVRVGDSVHVTFGRTRLSRRLVVTGVQR
jgi:hypothetical protein